MSQPIKNTNQEKNKYDNKFYSIFENSINGIILGKPDGTILEANSAFIDMFGYSITEIKKIGRQGLFDMNDPNMSNYEITRNQNGKSKGILIGIRKNGERFPCEFSSVIYEIENGEIRSSTILTDITERKKIEEEIQLLLNNTEEGFVLIDKNLKIISFNNQFKTQYELLFKKEIRKGDLILNYAQKNRKGILKTIYSKVLKGELIDNELKNDFGQNEVIYFHIKYKPAVNQSGNIIGVFVTLKDITNQKKEELRLKLLESVITNTTDSVLITEPDAKTGDQVTIFANNPFMEMTGYPIEELIGKSPRMFQGKNNDRKELDKIKKAIINYQKYQTEIINYKKNGEEFWVNMSISPVKNELGKPTHFIAIEKDVTKRKLREIEREHIISELSQINKDLKQFSYVISHNLRAPIANLLGLTTLIEQYKIPNKSLKIILEGIKQSALIFDDTIKDLTKVLIIKDQINIVKEKISLTEITNKVLSQLSITVDDNEVKVNYNFKEAPVVNFTIAYLESVLLNLFTNSLKYKSPKRKLKINIFSTASNGVVTLKFNDNGIGIDTEQHKEKLFKLYQRFHNNPDGKGLGLYLIKSQIEALGGTIDVESEVNVGTTFIITFKK